MKQVAIFICAFAVLFQLYSGTCAAPPRFITDDMTTADKNSFGNSQFGYTYANVVPEFDDTFTYVAPESDSTSSASVVLDSVDTTSDGSASAESASNESSTD